MKTPLLFRMVPLLVFIASFAGMPSRLSAADSTIPVVGIRTTVPATREPLCDPAICDAALPAPGVMVVTRRGGDLARELSVLLRYEGTAVNGTDYATLPQSVLFGSGVDSVELLVEATFDRVVEGEETVLARLLPDPSLGPVERYRLNSTQTVARVVIRDGQNSGASLEMTAPQEGAVFAVGQPIVIAATAIDPAGAITRVEFFDGETKIGESEIFFFREPDPGTPIHHEFVWKDATAGDHALTARGLDALGNRVSSSPIRISVEDPVPSVSIEASVPDTIEPSPNTRVRPAVFTLRRTGDASQPLRVWLLYAGSATPGSDFVPPPTMVEFSTNAAAVEVLIAPIDDDRYEGDETVYAMLIPPPLGEVSNYYISRHNARPWVTIHDNDLAPAVSISATQPVTSEPCPVCFVIPGVFTISHTGSTNEALSVWYLLDGTAKNGEDYLKLPGHVTIPAGRSSVDVLVLGAMDNVSEGDETVVARLQVPEVVIAIFPPPPPPYQIDPDHAEATIVIRDFPFTPPGDAVVSIVAADALAREGTNNSIATGKTATFVIQRSGPTNEALAVRYAVSGTASNGVDYVALSSLLRIPAGARRASLVITPINDSQPERIETVVITLVADDAVPADYTLGRPHRAAALILDNDRPRPPCLRLPDGLFNLCLLGQTNPCVRVEATRDLAGWTPLCTLPVNQGVAHFVDPDTPEMANRFYRLVPVPCEP